MEPVHMLAGDEYEVFTPLGLLRAFFPAETEDDEPGSMAGVVHWSGPPEAMTYLRNATLGRTSSKGYTISLDHLSPADLLHLHMPEAAIMVTPPLDVQLYLLEPNDDLGPSWQGVDQKKGIM